MTQHYSPGVMIYGGPSMLEYPTNPRPRPDPFPATLLPTLSPEQLAELAKVLGVDRSKGLVSDLTPTSRIRISTRTEEDGTLKLKIHVNNKFHSELISEDGKTITVEFEVGDSTEE